MKNRKTNDYYIDKILEDINFIMEHINLIAENEFGKNQLLQDSMMFRLIQISENAKNIEDDYKAKNENIPWFAMYGLRNRIVHDYGNIKLSVVYNTLVKDIPILKVALKSLLSNE